MKKYLLTVSCIFCAIAFAITGCANDTQRNGVYDGYEDEDIYCGSEEKNEDLSVDDENGEKIPFTSSEGVLESGIRYVFHATFSDMGEEFNLNYHTERLGLLREIELPGIEMREFELGIAESARTPSEAAEVGQHYLRWIDRQAHRGHRGGCPYERYIRIHYCSQTNNWVLQQVCGDYIIGDPLPFILIINRLDGRIARYGF